MRFNITLIFGVYVSMFFSPMLMGQEDPAASENQVLKEELGSVTAFAVGQRSGLPNVKFFAFADLPDTSTRATIVEDTAILNHLISKALPPEGDRSFLGVSVAQQYGKQEAMYIGGNGLILVYHVGFPVAPSVEQPSSLAADETKLSSEWERAKSQLQTESRLTRYGKLSRKNMGNLVVSDSMRYDKEKVGQLDDAIRSALSQAGNFRDIRPPQSITVYAYGPSLTGTSGRVVRSVMAWRVNMSDFDSSKSVPRSKIQSVRYVESGSKGLLPGSISR